MTKRIRHQHDRPRTSLAVTGTTHRVEASLDHRASLAVAYAQRWLHIGPGSMGLAVAASGVIRRALQVYMDHLAMPMLDPEEEARAVHRCCTSLTADEATQKAAMARLAVADSPTSFPPFRDVLDGFDAAKRRAEFDAKHQAILEQIAGTPWGRMKGFKAND